MSRDLNDLHPYVKVLAEKLIAECKKQGLSPTLTSTLRTMDGQANIYAQGRTKPGKIISHAKPGHSYHNYGLAVDLSFPKHADYAKAGEIGKKLGFRWGGDFKVFSDLPHFEWSGDLKIADLLKGKRPENPLEMTVKDFQKAFGLDDDGIIGPITKAKMKEALTLINKYVKGEKLI